MKPLKGTRTHDNLKAAFAGESQANRRYLYFASKADVEGQNDVAASVPLDRRRRDRPRARAPRLPGSGRRPGDRSADRLVAPEPEGRGGRRDARIHRHVPGDGQVGARRGVRGDRGLVRDAGESRALARQSVPEGARRIDGLSVCSEIERRGEVATLDLRAARSRGWTAAAARDEQRAMTIREGSLEAPTRHPLDWRNPEFYDEASLDKELRADLRHLPRLPPLRQPVPVVPDAVRPRRRGQDR